MGIDEFLRKALTNEEVKVNPNDTGVEAYEYKEPNIYGISLKDWKSAVEQAWAEYDPNRVELCDIYKAITTYDSQTITAINQRKLLTMQGDIAFYNEDGTINEEATKLIKSPSNSTKLWFRDFISMCLDSIFWGYELIAINVKNGKILVRKVPERNVVSNKGVILRDASYGYANSNIIQFNKGKLDLITCKIAYNNDINDLGLLSAVAPYFLSKVTGNWKMHAEKFGMLTRILKTSSENKAKLTGGYNMLKNQVRGNFVVLGENDELTFEGDNRTSVDIYEKLNKYCDSSISKIILGQSSSTDEKTYAGSANVHKSILDSIIKSDREFIEAIVNDQLVPKLQMFGVLPDNVYFGISENVDIDIKQLAETVKLLSDSGFKIARDFIEEKFDIKLEENKEENKEEE